MSQPDDGKLRPYKPTSYLKRVDGELRMIASDTPRTDAEESKTEMDSCSDMLSALKHSDAGWTFARQLERELAKTLLVAEPDRQAQILAKFKKYLANGAGEPESNR